MSQQNNYNHRRQHSMQPTGNSYVHPQPQAVEVENAVLKRAIGMTVTETTE